MRALSALIVLIVFVLWFVSATLIAAPIEVVQSMLPPNLSFTHVQLEMLGVVLFIMSMLLITLWALSGNDEEVKTGAKVSVPPAVKSA